MFAGAFAGAILVGFFSDFVGRRKTMLFSLTICVIGTIVVVVVNDVAVRCIGFLCWGIGSDVIFPIGLTYVVDIIAE